VSLTSSISGGGLLAFSTTLISSSDGWSESISLQRLGPLFPFLAFGLGESELSLLPLDSSLMSVVTFLFLATPRPFSLQTFLLLFLHFMAGERTLGGMPFATV
jgi:hypothetical protein